MTRPMPHSHRGASHLDQAGDNSRRYRARDPVVTARIMAAVRSTDSKCELLLRRELWSRGLRYRLHRSHAASEPLPGRPDLVFTQARVLVFIDGDFWHGRALLRGGEEALARMFRPAKRAWWVPKISGNVARDRRRTRALRTAGWRVIRIWESDVLRAPGAAADRVQRAVERARAKAGRP